MLRIWLFGRVRFQVDDGEILYPKEEGARRLLAYLALNAGRHLDRRRAEQEVWGYSGDNLRRALSDLRAAFSDAGLAHEQFIEAGQGGRGRLGEIGLIDPESLWIDAHEFEHLWEEDPGAAITLARGEFLGGIRTPGDWLERRQAEFKRRLVHAYGALAEETWARGPRPQALILAEQRREIAPESQAAICDLMRLLAKDGQRAAAIDEAEGFLRRMRPSGDDLTRVEKLLEKIRRGEVKVEDEPESAAAEASSEEAVSVTAPAGGPRLPPRALALIAVVAILIVVAGILAIGGGGGEDGTPAGPVAGQCGEGVTALDPTDLAIAADGPPIEEPVGTKGRINLGDRPAVAVAGREGIWVGEHQGLVLIDPAKAGRSGNLIETVSGVYSLALAEDRIWATLRNGTLVSVDRTTRKLVGKPIDYGSGEGDVAVGAGSVWVNNYGVEALDGRITRIDPCSRELERIRIGRSAVTVKYGAGNAIWASDPANEAVARVDPKTEEVETIPGFVDPQDLGVTDDAVWVVQYADQTVVRVDPTTLEVRGRPIRVGPDPGGIAAGEDQLWLPLYGNGTATRVDLSSERSELGVVKVGQSPTDAAMGFGRVWVPNNGGDTVAVVDAARSEGG